MDQRRLRKKLPSDPQFKSKLTEAVRTERRPRIREQLAVLKSFYLDGKSHREVQEVTGMPIHRIKNLLRRVQAGGVEAVRGGRGRLISGRNKNFLLSPDEEAALMLRYRTGEWGTAAETRDFLIDFRTLTGIEKAPPTLSAIREYLKKFSGDVNGRRARRDGMVVFLEDEVALLLSRRDCRVWRHILAATLMDSGSARDAMNQIVRSLHYPVEMWQREWKFWRRNNPQSRTVVGRCTRMLGLATCNTLLAEMPVAPFQWPEDGSPVDGDHFGSWKVLGFYLGPSTSILVMGRKKRTPRGGLFYRSGYLVFRRMKAMKAVPRHILVKRIKTHLGPQVSPYLYFSRPSRREVVVFATDPALSDRLLSSFFGGSREWKGETSLADTIRYLSSLRAPEGWSETSHRKPKK